jgi:hypothetical protein
LLFWTFFNSKLAGMYVTVIFGLSQTIQSVSNSIDTNSVRIPNIGDDISMKSSNVKININDVCDLISVSSEHFN